MENYLFTGFDWDDAKEKHVLRERGFDFTVAAHIFVGSCVEFEDHRTDYGQRKFHITGEVDGLILTVVWTPRNSSRRIITAWPASLRERVRFMSIVRKSMDEIRRGKGTIDKNKVLAATETQIEAWKRADGIVDDDVLSSARVTLPETNLRELREHLALSQEEFAQRFMLSIRTVQEWEQQRRAPSEAARVFLFAIQSDPEAMARILHQGHPKFHKA